MSNRPIRQRLRAALSALFDAANPRETFRRPYEITVSGNVAKEVTRFDRLRMVSDSEKVYANWGPGKGAINDKAMYAVGRSWLPRFEGEDKEWGQKARTWLLDQWYPIADIQGRDFQSALFLLSISVDRSGDIGGVLTQYETGFPAIQLIPGYAIGQREKDVDKNGVLTSGDYKGLRMVDGVVMNDVGRAVAYRILGPSDKGEDDKFISAQDMQLLMEPEWPGQVRGLPGFAGAILDLRDMRDTQGYEKMAARLCSAWALMEYSETGVADTSDPRVGLGGGGLPATTTVQEMSGGLVKHFKANSGGKLEMLKSDRPGDSWESFQNRMIRTAMKDLGWPYELGWDISGLTGANGRMMLATAMRAVEDRQDLIRPFAKRAVGYACMKAINQGILPPSEDWWRWGFTMPPRMTADYGRDKSQDREDYLAGITNLTELCAERGLDVDQHIAQRAEENAKLEEADLPLPITPQQAQIEIAEHKAEAAPQPQDKPESQKPDDKSEDAEMSVPSAPAPIVEPPAAVEAPKPEPVVIQFNEAVAELDARVKEQATLESACAQIAERRKRLAK